MPQTAAKASPDFSASLAEHFADREGLTGPGRIQFLQFIQGSLGASRPIRRSRWKMLLFISLGVGLTGLVLDLATVTAPVPSGALLWCGFSILGLVLSLLLRRAEHHDRPVDHEIHWRAYCLLVRPVVLAQKPGLLDRNLADDRGRHDELELTPFWSFGHMLRERGADFWWSGGIGVLSGTLALILWHRLVPHTLAFLEMALPVTGMLIGPAAWALIQTTAYWLARRQSRHLRD